MAKVAELLAPGERLDGGRGLMPWQRLVADVLGEVDPATGRFAYETGVIKVPRQAGKTLLVFSQQLQRAKLRRMARGWYTAQTQKDAAGKMMDDWAPLLELGPFKRAVSVRRTVGSQGFRVRKTGSTIGVFPPTRAGLHSKQADQVDVDEGWAFDLAQGREIEQGVRPAQITRKQRQFCIWSAAGDVESTWLAHYTKLGREIVASGEPSKMAYFEWSAADRLDDVADPYDPELLRATHPALGYTIELDAIWADAETMDTAEFARAYLCIDTLDRTEHVISLQSWYACQDDVVETSVISDPVTFAVDVAFDRSAGAIGAAGVRPDGNLQVEVVDYRAGTGWLVDRVAQLIDTWSPKATVIDPYGPARGVGAELERKGYTITSVNAGEVATACGDFLDDVVELRLRHLGQGVLDSAVHGAGKRPIGDAWGWGRRTSRVDISPLVAVTLARWAAAGAVELLIPRIY